jgi:peptide/nickel transport system substrate-binding protein
MRTHRRSLLLAGLAAPGILSTTTRAALAQDQRRTIRAVPIGDLRALDPIWTTAYITRNHGYLVYDTLFALDANNTPQPQMVESHHVSSDGLRWEFTLRPGLTWHNDAPVRAADCVASIRRWAAKDGMGRALIANALQHAMKEALYFSLIGR